MTKKFAFLSFPRIFVTWLKLNCDFNREKWQIFKI